MGDRAASRWQHASHVHLGMLGWRELLAVSRCSRSLHAAARHPYLWRDITLRSVCREDARGTLLASTTRRVLATAGDVSSDAAQAPAVVDWRRLFFVHLALCRALSAAAAERTAITASPACTLDARPMPWVSTGTKLAACAVALPRRQYEAIAPIGPPAGAGVGAGAGAGAGSYDGADGTRRARECGEAVDWSDAAVVAAWFAKLASEQEARATRGGGATRRPLPIDSLLAATWSKLAAATDFEGRDVLRGPYVEPVEPTAEELAAKAAAEAAAKEARDKAAAEAKEAARVAAAAKAAEEAAQKHGGEAKEEAKTPTPPAEPQKQPESEPEPPRAVESDSDDSDRSSQWSSGTEMCFEATAQESVVPRAGRVQRTAWDIAGSVADVAAAVARLDFRATVEMRLPREFGAKLHTAPHLRAFMPAFMLTQAATLRVDHQPWRAVSGAGVLLGLLTRTRLLQAVPRRHLFGRWPLFSKSPCRRRPADGDGDVGGEEPRVAVGEQPLSLTWEKALRVRFDVNLPGSAAGGQPHGAGVDTSPARTGVEVAVVVQATVFPEFHVGVLVVHETRTHSF